MTCPAGHEERGSKIMVELVLCIDSCFWYCRSASPASCWLPSSLPTSFRSNSTPAWGNQKILITNDSRTYSFFQQREVLLRIAWTEYSHSGTSFHWLMPCESSIWASLLVLQSEKILRNHVDCPPYLSVCMRLCEGAWRQSRGSRFLFTYKLHTGKRFWLGSKQTEEAFPIASHSDTVYTMLFGKAIMTRDDEAALETWLCDLVTLAIPGWQLDTVMVGREEGPA